ncbi:MAG: hypothetical protein R6V34_12790 [Bacteroidales bacterium]
MSKEYTWEYGGMLPGFDPVAVDSAGIRILQAKRKQPGLISHRIPE